MVVPEEEPEEEWEKEEEHWEEESRRRGKRRGVRNRRRATRRRNKKRTIKPKVYMLLHYWKHMSHFLVIIHLLFTDGLENGGWGRQQMRMKTSTGTFIRKKDKYETRVHK